MHRITPILTIEPTSNINNISLFAAIFKTQNFQNRIFKILFLTPALLSFFSLSFLINVGYAQDTKRFIQNNGDWNTGNNWEPRGIPQVEDHIIFPSNIERVRGVPNNNSAVSRITLEGTGNLEMQGVNNNGTLKITSSLSIPSGRTLILNRVSIDFEPTSVSFISGELSLNSPGQSGNTVLNVSGDLSITHTGIITQVTSGSFILNPAATLRVGSSAGISLTGMTGNIRTLHRSFST
jgi:hypothetical protein